MSTTLFISDLHLSADRPALTALFLVFLRGRAPRAETLYILGDLFEVWLGDDAVHPAYHPVLSALRELAARRPVYVMHGNRDFLLVNAYAQASGCRLLADPSVSDLNGERTLLMHGDVLCTDDVEYLQFRAHVRNSDTQRHFLGLAIEQRIAMAKQFRDASRDRILVDVHDRLGLLAGALAAGIAELLRHGDALFDRQTEEVPLR